VAQSLDNLAGVLLLKPKEISVDLLYLRALAIRKKVFGTESHQAIASMNDLGVGYAEEGKFPEAEQAFAETVALLLRKTQQDPATLAIVYTNMSNLFDMEGKHRKARKMAERARACREQEGTPG
jgi:Flp pilus assembly protein TadD